MKCHILNNCNELTCAPHIPDVSVLFNGNSLAIWIYDATTLQFLDANESAISQYGYAREDFLRLTLTDILLPDEQPLTTDHHQHGSQHSNIFQKHLRRDGTQIEVAIRSNDVAYRGRQCKLIIAEDVTERRTIDAELLQMANYDALTGLPNRALLNDRMAQALAAAQRQKHKTAIISIDLDHFKKINDCYGHAIGDDYLKHVAGSLTRRLRGMDTVARMGGDEFTIVLGEVDSVKSAGLVGKLLLRTLNKPTVIGGYSFQPGASLGIAVFPDHGADMNEVWRCADAAMYRAKRAGGNRFLVAGPDPCTPADDNAALDLHLRDILDNNHLLVHYQFQYSPHRKLRGMEALLRIPDAVHGHTSTDRVIARAEDNGMIYPIGRCVVEEVCRQMHLWNKVTASPVRVALRKEFATEVAASLSKWNIDPESLEMEISEKAIVNFDDISAQMNELYEMGIRFIVDDFGTNYSSLRHLHRLPISTLKIDRSLVQRLCDSAGSYPIVNAIIALGHSMNMEVIAVGVEHEEQKQILERLGCDGMQGYLFAKPVSAEEITRNIGAVSKDALPLRRIDPSSIRKPLQTRSINSMTA
jgi:diguanylate cyclase (GGDEF)-like protein/PAS domain S-box-containing protein